MGAKVLAVIPATAMKAVGLILASLILFATMPASAKGTADAKAKTSKAAGTHAGGHSQAENHSALPGYDPAKPTKKKTPQNSFAYFDEDLVLPDGM